MVLVIFLSTQLYVYLDYHIMANHNHWLSLDRYGHLAEILSVNIHLDNDFHNDFQLIKMLYNSKVEKKTHYYPLLNHMIILPDNHDHKYIQNYLPKTFL